MHLYLANRNDPLFRIDTKEIQILETCNFQNS